MDEGSTPPGLRLDGPAPNPTTGVTSVRFALPRATRAELGVFDLASRRIRTLASGTLAAGEHAASWDGRDMAGRRSPTGLYFVRLFADGAVRSRCLVLAR